MRPMFLPDVEKKASGGKYSDLMERLQTEGAEVPQIYHLFRFKPEMTQHLAQLSHEIMRGPSPLSPGLRELIAAFTSKENQCPF
ncbi:MAG: peroxidase [Acidobacteria bacterium]|nr:MAG: peroxidase [Acidobacteriota bacterium]